MASPGEAKAKREATLAGRQRCLCGHQRRRHHYRNQFHFDASSCRWCMVEGCSCPNFILLKRTIL